jgi:hypothetical protein
VPTAEQHRAQVAANRELYDEIGGRRSAHPDWALTILFYAAVHEIAALLVEKRGTVIGSGYAWPVTTHGDRYGVLVKHTPWNRLATYYDNFYRWSRRTRYDCEMPDEDRLRKMEDVLERIREEIAALG